MAMHGCDEQNGPEVRKEGGDRKYPIVATPSGYCARIIAAWAAKDRLPAEDLFHRLAHADAHRRHHLHYGGLGMVR